MSRTDDSRARLADLANSARTQARAHSDTQARTHSGTQAREQSPAPPQRTRPVRMSVDWLPADHRRIRATCAELAEQTGRVSIPAADLVRAAVDLVLSREDLRADLTHALAERQGSL